MKINRETMFDIAKENRRYEIDNVQDAKFFLSQNGFKTALIKIDNEEVVIWDGKTNQEGFMGVVSPLLITYFTKGETLKIKDNTIISESSQHIKNERIRYCLKNLSIQKVKERIIPLDYIIEQENKHERLERKAITDEEITSVIKDIDITIPLNIDSAYRIKCIDETVMFLEINGYKAYKGMDENNNPVVIFPNKSLTMFLTKNEVFKMRTKNNRLVLLFSIHKTTYEQDRHTYTKEKYNLDFSECQTPNRREVYRKTHESLKHNLRYI